MPNMLPYNVFPGFTAHGVISDAVREMVMVFNAEGVSSLSGISPASVAWASVGSRFTSGMIDGKVPIRITSLLGFEPFDGERKYHGVNVAAIPIKAAPWSLALEWPIQVQQAPGAKDVYGVSGIASDVVDHGRALKADLLASLVTAGQTNSSLSMTASALTIAQPGLANGLPLFSDGSSSGSSQHYANPLDVRSTKFKNLYLNAGQFTAQGVFGQSLVDMAQVPHPSKANMTLGLGVTDVVGPTHMMIPFWQEAIQTLALQTTTSPANLAVAATNIYSPDALERAGAEKFVGASGLAPWRFWIAPQLDAHPYVVANPGKHMWLSISQSRPSLKWAEFIGPNSEFVPGMTLLGDGSEEAKKSRMIRLFGDLDAGVAAGLPHCCKLYFETTP